MSKTNTLPKIEKGIPMPKAQKTGITDLLRSMQVGDSVLVTKKDAKSMLVINKRVEIKIATRKVSETEMRVWRIA